MEELRDAVKTGEVDAPHGVREEVGDVLFMAAQIARDHGVDPEDALHRSCDKFARRFRAAEELAGDLHALTPEAQRECWNKAKERETLS